MVSVGCRQSTNARGKDDDDDDNDGDERPFNRAIWQLESGGVAQGGVMLGRRTHVK